MNWSNWNFWWDTVKRLQGGYRMSLLAIMVHGKHVIRTRFQFVEVSLTLICKSWKTHPEIFLKFSFSGSSHRPFYWKTHPDIFRNFISGASHRPFYWKTHPLKIMDTYTVFFNSGASHRPFYWKTHPFKLWLKPYTGAFYYKTKC